MTRQGRSRRLVGDEPYRQVGVQLPVATLAIIDAERASCGWHRAFLLELLLLTKLGKCHFARRGETPTYQFESQEWTTTRRFIWHQRTELYTLFNGLLLRLGNLSPRAWIVLAVNEFVALPTWSPGNDAA